MARKVELSRKTKETDIFISLDLDGQGEVEIDIPIKFFGHMLEALGKHSMLDIRIIAKGDIEVDQHHLIEDLGIVLGRGIRQALGDYRGIFRAGSFIYPMDDALAMVAVDLSGRPYIHFEADFRRRFCGDYDTDLTKHFFEALTNGMQANIAIKLLAGENDHHKLEAIFKGLAKSLRQAWNIDPRASNTIPSTKGVIL